MNRLVSAGSTAVFRIGFGLVGLVLTIRFFAHGWIDSLLIDPQFHFTYPGFGWVEPLPAPAMYSVFALMGLSAISIAVGFRHRVGAGVFAVALAYVELIDRTNYLNHYYWMVLTAGLMVFLPMGATWSVDARHGRVTRPGLVPVWVVWLLRFQVGMVYFFAGVAKLNPDWLFRAEPLATWLPARAEIWLLGPLLALPATAFVLSWAGALFDLTIVGWLMIGKTRGPAFVVLVGFHTFTWLLFPSIGVFPLLMSLGALIFFEPAWPMRLARRETRPDPGGVEVRRIWVAVTAIYILAMVLIPLRHLAIPGDVRVDGDGYQGSWQVMLTDKTGSVEFEVTRDGRSWLVPAPDYLTDRQAAVMATDPALIQQMARLIVADTGGSVSAHGRIVINGRPAIEYAIALPDEATPREVAVDWVTAAP